MRPDGKKVKSDDAEYAVVPHIMVDRNDSLNFIEIDVPLAPIQKYLNENESGKDVRIFNEKNLINEEIEEKIYKPTMKMRKDVFKVWSTIGQVSNVSANLLGGLVYIFVGLKALAGAFGAGKVVE